MSLNQNFPVVEDAWSPSTQANGGASPAANWVDLTGRTQVSTSIKRGKQYELDAIQSGTYDTVLNNQDGALDPMNTAGPWAGSINPYQPLRHRVQWHPTVNRLPQTLASGGEGYSAGVIPSAFGITSQTDSTGGSIVALGTGVAYEESNAFQFAVPSGSAGGSVVCSFDAGAVAPGTPYTFSTYVRNVTASTSITLTANLEFLVAGSSVWAGTNVTLTGSATATWTRVTVSGTAPSGVTGATLMLALPSGTPAASTCSIQVDGQQWEIGSTATAWVYPGYWYPLFTGWAERWPSEWTDGGTRGLVKPTGVDALAFLSQITLQDPLTHEVNYLAPRFLYRMDDPAGSLTSTDGTGNNRTAQLVSAKQGSGSVAYGTSITGTDPVNGIFTGTGTVLEFNNPNYAVDQSTSGGFTGGTFLSLAAAGITGPANTAEWTRTISFRYTGSALTSSNTAVLWSCYDSNSSFGVPSGSSIRLTLASNGVAIGINGVGNSSTSVLVNGSYGDGNWHHVVFGMSVSQTKVICCVDGNYQSTTYTGPYMTAATPGNLTSDTLGGDFQVSQGGWANFFWKGDLAYAAEFPGLLSYTSCQNVYSAWRNACNGDSTDQRVYRILRYAGYAGGTWIDGGMTKNMGPATDITGTDALSALQAVADTESGEFHIRSSGTFRFLSRAARYNALVPVITFGDGPGEYPYEDLQLDYDPTHLANQITITQNSTNANFVANDATSVANYMPRVFSRTVNNNNTAEIQDQANYLLSRYKGPQTRVSSLKIHLSANTSLWDIIGNIELGTRIRVMRRPFGAQPIQVDCFIEQIQWDFDDKGEAWCTMQCSPADPQPYTTFAAWRTTLGAAAPSGQAQITVNAPAGNTLALASIVGVGTQLVVGQGGSVPETMTVKSVSATSPGWTTGVITFTANLAHSHTNGFNVGEPLPSTVTNPATWDSVAVFDSTAFAY